MSLYVAPSAQAQELRARNGLRSFASGLLLAAVTFCLATFLVGWPIAGLQSSFSEVRSQDAVSVGDDVPTTWLRRNASRIDKYVGVHLGPMSGVDSVPPEGFGEQTSVDPVEAIFAFTTQRRHAAPVRGPPRVRV
jgi:hypothetical protein